jgi:protein SCO1/2
MTRTMLRIVGAFAAVTVLLGACQPQGFKGTEYLDPQPAPDFVLTRSDGGELRLSDQIGKVILLFFGFTACPDVCPTTLADARRILEGLDEQAVNAEYLFVTVDPDRDTPEVLETYIGHFDPAILGLTGTPQALAEVWKDYGIFVEKVPLQGSALDYTVTHTARVFVIDQEGDLRLSYSFGTPYEDILDDVRRLMSS